MEIERQPFETHQSYSQEEPVIKPIIEATIKLCKTLNFDLKKNYVVLERGFTELIFIYGCGVFDVRLSDGVVIVSTENGWCFTREQFNAIFDFIDVIKKSLTAKVLYIICFIGKNLL